ncbi:pyridoxamine 5'-phosphate oxidase family protein [Streptomyces longhuiensis]|uniref:pyridoxamine 5'-phosphate oxidase family protein n=1 Tax=Streptomyces TaxID=1883 RepID=UPI001D0ABED7|nr:pyridoxamine 5'-phosphate oxidase family protein [Streptomyces longhuiensis]UDL97458.1 pyridoxamine 5'-phosphate oxidase family protein [Streptomyces longhuiensis]
MERKDTGRSAGQDSVTQQDRRVRNLDRDEALRLLATVSMGRLVFTQRALPAVRPVTHLVEGEDIVVRLDEGSALSLVTDPGTPGVVVAYEADVIDPESHLGWSVVVTGFAYLVADAEEGHGSAERLRPWAGRSTHSAVRIQPDVVNGFRLEAEPPEAAP